MVAQKRCEITIGEPGLGIKGQEHGANAEEGRFKKDPVYGWPRGQGGGGFGVGERQGRSGRRGGGGGKGDAGAQALAPEHNACGGGGRIITGGVGENGVGVENQARF